MPLPQQEITCVCRCPVSDKLRQPYLNNYDTPKTVCQNAKVRYCKNKKRQTRETYYVRYVPLTVAQPGFIQ